MLRRTHIFALGVLGATALLSGCGTATLLPGPSAQTVSNLVFRETGFRPASVDCPSGVPAKVGATMECHFDGPDGHYVAIVRPLSIHGSRVIDHIVTRRIS